MHPESVRFSHSFLQSSALATSYIVPMTLSLVKVQVSSSTEHWPLGRTASVSVGKSKREAAKHSLIAEFMVQLNYEPMTYEATCRKIRIPRMDFGYFKYFVDLIFIQFM